MKIAIITLSQQGCMVASRIHNRMPDTDVFVHESVDTKTGLKATRFSRIIDLAADIFDRYQGFIYIAPCGVVLRAVAPLVEHKTTDPAVVVVDVGARYAISLLSGHEGEANNLAVKISNILGAEPVITTTTEAEKNIIIGVGCRKNTEAENIKHAVTSATDENGISMDQVRLLASADVKSEEQGLLQAAYELKLPIRFIPSVTINTFGKAFDASDFVTKKVGLPAVAEPAALLAGRRTSLIQKKKTYGGITIAIAVENFS